MICPDVLLEILRGDTQVDGTEHLQPSTEISLLTHCRQVLPKTVASSSFLISSLVALDFILRYAGTYCVRSLSMKMDLWVPDSLTSH